ncbi:MAG: hypothetical protein AABX59_02280 [Nanoarchaeota archaeon]
MGRVKIRDIYENGHGLIEIACSPEGGGSVNYFTLRSEHFIDRGALMPFDGKHEFLYQLEGSIIVSGEGKIFRSDGVLVYVHNKNNGKPNSNSRKLRAGSELEENLVLV